MLKKKYVKWNSDLVLYSTLPIGVDRVARDWPRRLEGMGSHRDTRRSVRLAHTIAIYLLEPRARLLARLIALACWY